MKRVSTRAPCVIFDDFVPTKQWEQLWRHFAQTPFSPVSTLQYAWRPHDGQPFAGPLGYAFHRQVDARAEDGTRIRSLPRAHGSRSF